MVLVAGVQALGMLALIVLLGMVVISVKQAIAALVAAINANTAAVNNAVSVGFSDPADVANLTAATQVLSQNTAALVTATPIPAAPAQPAQPNVKTN